MSIKIGGVDNPHGIGIASSQINNRSKRKHPAPSKPVPKDKHSKPKPSKSQSQLAKCMRRVLVGNPPYKQEVTWSWLKTEAGANLYVDIVFSGIKLAIEYNGPQHYRRTKYTPTNRSLEAQKSRDALKIQLLEEHGYTVISWPYTRCISMKAVHEVLIENGFKAEIPPRKKPTKRAVKRRNKPVRPAKSRVRKLSRPLLG